MSSEQTVTAAFEAVPPTSTQKTTVTPPTLGTVHLHFARLRRSSRHFAVTVSGLTAGARVTGILRAARRVLVRATATATVNGTAVLKFTFGKSARRRLQAHRLRQLQLQVTAALGPLRAPTVTKTLKLGR